MTLVFMLEEESMKEMLDGLMPRLFPGVAWIPVVHQGKNDLEKSLPRKLRAWNEPDARFIVVRDQDAADCLVVKDRLAGICRQSGRPGCLIRLSCREMESWFLGDLQAVETATNTQNLAKHQYSRKFREPDKLGTPSAELKRLVPHYQKVSGARAIGKHLRAEGNRSHSFGVFLTGIQKLLP